MQPWTSTKEQAKERPKQAEVHPINAPTAELQWNQTESKTARRTHRKPADTAPTTQSSSQRPQQQPNRAKESDKLEGTKIPNKIRRYRNDRNHLKSGGIRWGVSQLKEKIRGWHATHIRKTTQLGKHARLRGRRGREGFCGTDRDAGGKDSRDWTSQKNQLQGRGCNLNSWRGTHNVRRLPAKRFTKAEGWCNPDSSIRALQKY